MQRERERQSDRHTERRRETETETEKDRQTDRCSLKGKDIENRRRERTSRQTDGQTDRQRPTIRNLTSNSTCAKQQKLCVTVTVSKRELNKKSNLTFKQERNQVNPKTLSYESSCYVRHGLRQLSEILARRRQSTHYSTQLHPQSTRKRYILVFKSAAIYEQRIER